MYGNTLVDHAASFPLRLCLFPHNVLHLMPPHSRAGSLRCDVCRRFEGHTRVVRAILIFAFLAGLTFSLLCRFLDRKSVV